MTMRIHLALAQRIDMNRPVQAMASSKNRRFEKSAQSCEKTSGCPDEECVRHRLAASRLGEPMITPDPNDLGQDDQELQLPMHGLFADLALGRGSVLLPDEFLHCPGLSQLRIIEQWLSALSRYRCNALRLLQDELAAGHPAASPAERLGLLRAVCDAEGIAVAADADAGSACP
jgi:hypothetical protein